MTLAVGIDIGGTKIAGGIVTEAGEVLALTRRATPSSDTEAVIEVIVEVTHELAARHEVVAVGIGAAGFIDSGGARVLFSPHLAWRDSPLREDIASRLDVPVLLDNDANTAAWAEHRFGAGERERDMVMLTVGTGIGGGLVIDGQLRRGRFGLAGEPGHVRMVPDGRPCSCGQRGCFEQYCSGEALVRAARELAVSEPQRARGLLGLVRGDVARIDGPIVTQAARDGDPAAIECFTEIGRWLGQAIADLAAVLDPGRVVVGGGVGEAGELLLRSARTVYAQSLVGRGYRPLAEVVSARLGADAGLIGAADLARRMVAAATGAAPVVGHAEPVAGFGDNDAVASGTSS